MTRPIPRRVKESTKVLNKIEGVISNNYVYSIRQAKKYMRALFEQSKFKIGDKLALAKTPEITLKKSWGWLGAKHYLIEGSPCIVRDVDYYHNTFVYDVAFLNESWKHYKTGELHNKPMVHLYSFGEGWLRKYEGQFPEAPEWCQCDSCKYDREKYGPK